MPHVKLARRTFLKGAGAALALPLLDAMLPVRASAGDGPEQPLRLVFVFVPNGVHMPDWTPAAEGAEFALPFLLEPLDAVRSQVQVLSGLALDNARAKGDGPGDHARAAASFLTCEHPRKTGGADLRAGISVDQVAAARIGGATRFPSLELGAEPARQSGECDSGYSCAYSSSISWRTPSQPSGKEVDPRLVFERLFGDSRVEPAERERRRALRRSILDGATAQARALSGRLGAEDRAKLDEYLTAVREVERRLHGPLTGDVPEGAVPPAGLPADTREHLDLLSDLIVLAFRADQTRVVSFMFANAGSNRSYPQLGVREGHHSQSHHGNDPAKIADLRRINRFHVERLAHLLGGLRAAADGDGTLLDRTMLVYGSAIGDGNRHNHDDLPILLAGGGNGTLAGGRHVRFPQETPLANVYLSLLDRANVRLTRFADSTGRLPV